MRGAWQTGDGLRTRVLWGSEHVDYGDIAVQAAAPSVAVALSRGRRPKPYRWVDPNEDVVAAVVGPRATLLAVADGHNGAVASETAMRTVLDLVGDDPPESADDAALLDLFVEAGRAVEAATRERDDERRASRTTLSIALVGGGRVQWATMGDSPVLVAEGRKARELSRPGMQFVGAPLSTVQLQRAVHRGRARLGAGSWVIVASDGFSDYCRQPTATAARIVQTANDASDAARALVEAAFAGGGADNVAVAVAGPRQRS